MIAITISGTEGYTYAMRDQARRIQSCVVGQENGLIILNGDHSLQDIVHYYKRILPGWNVIYEPTIHQKKSRTKESLNLFAAQLRTEAFTIARSFKLDYCWALDADVLPPENALRCMIQSLEFDDGYYSVSSCPYVCRTGDNFLGGRGSFETYILPSLYEDEREVPQDVVKRLGELKNEMTGGVSKERAERINLELKGIEQMIKEAPSDKKLSEMLVKFSKRLRGWYEYDFMPVGKGCIVPTDWFGFGCLLMNKKALNLAHFDGYPCHETEDLYVGWEKFTKAGLRFNILPHCLCDHVVRNPGYEEGKNGKYVMLQAFHESTGSEAGRMRFRHMPYYPMDYGNEYDETNNGQLDLVKKLT